MMLVHIRQSDVATRIHNAWLKTIEDGVYTADLQGARTGRAFGTMEFAAAVSERLGQSPVQWKPVRYDDAPQARTTPRPLYVRRKPGAKLTVGVDVFVHAADASADHLAGRLQTLIQQPTPVGFKLQMITNRGVKVWPGGFPETFCTDHWRCRFLGVDANGAPRAVTHADIVALLHNCERAHLDFIKTENLCTFDGEAGYALGQGQ
jgi:isocitrate dehydrogenase